MKLKPVMSASLTAFGAQGFRILVSLITLPVLLGYLGEDKLGIWMICLSAIGLVGSLNKGLVSGLITTIGINGPLGKIEEMEASISSTAVLAFGAGLLTASLLSGVIIFVDIIGYVNPDDFPLDRDDLLTIGVVAIIAISTGFICSLPESILIGLLKGYQAHLIDMVAAGISLLGILGGILAKQPISILLALFLLPPYVVRFGVGFLLVQRAGLTFWNRKLVRRRTLLEQFLTGSRLSIVQLSFSLANNSDIILVGVIVGPAEAALYGIVMRVFSLPVLVAQVWSQSLWPALSAASSNGDRPWLRSIYLRSVFYLVLFGCFTGGFAIIYFDNLTKLWMDAIFEPSAALLLGMAVWVVMMGYISPTGALLRARGETNFLMSRMALMAAINVPVSILLIMAVGAPGAIWGTVISYLVALILPYAYWVPKTLRP